MRIIDRNLFDANVVSGLVTRNSDIFHPYGFSISETEYINTQYVENCKQQLALELKIDKKNILKQKQIHSDRILVVEDNNAIAEADAMITKHIGICISVSLADCIGVLIYDSSQKVIAAVHSGWKGTHLNIIGKVIDKMISEFNCESQNLQFYISPSALVDNYEVGKEFIDYFPNTTEIRNGKIYFDNLKTLKLQIFEKNCKKENIYCSPLDTFTNEDLQSFRRDKKNAGRMTAYIMLK